jgi:hypothetical protein
MIDFIALSGGLGAFRLSVHDNLPSNKIYSVTLFTSKPCPDCRKKLKLQIGVTNLGALLRLGDMASLNRRKNPKNVKSPLDGL